MAEITDHGQQLDLRTRRGADWSLRLELWADEAHTTPLDVAGASGVSRIFADGQADVVMTAVVTNSVTSDPSTIDLYLSSATTLNMQQNWQYVVGYKDAAGATHPLVFGAFLVSQERI